MNGRNVNVYLDSESLMTLQEEAKSHGLSLSAWLRVIARVLKEPAPPSMPVADLRHRFSEIREDIYAQTLRGKR
jgi:hypothetical protein